MHTEILWILIVAFVASHWILSNSTKKKINKLREEIRSLRKDEMVWKRAQMKDLIGSETKDLHNLVFYQSRGETDRFKYLLNSTSEKVRAAYREWEERDRPKYDTYIASI